MKIIDLCRKGNIVRFILGADDCDDYWGDDWDDRPYEHNAGAVNRQFVRVYRDVSFSFDDIVLEPCDGEWNSPWSKEDMKERRVPCLVVIPAAPGAVPDVDSFSAALASELPKLVYHFGDAMDPSQ